MESARIGNGTLPISDKPSKPLAACPAIAYGEEPVQELKLIIGNHNYSSWSLRPWLMLRFHEIPFQCHRISLFTEKMERELAPYFSDNKVPVLIDGETEIWDSLAILEYLAERKPTPVIHHDIKPANLVLDKHGGDIRLVDFGTAQVRLAAQADARIGMHRSSIFGTAGYAPPEQYQGKSVPQSDVFALAATMYHLLTDDDPQQHPMSFPWPASLPAGLERAMARAVEPDLRKRSTHMWTQDGSRRYPLLWAHPASRALPGFYEARQGQWPRPYLFGMSKAAKPYLSCGSSPARCGVGPGEDGETAMK